MKHSRACVYLIFRNMVSQLQDLPYKKNVYVDTRFLMSTKRKHLPVLLRTRSQVAAGRKHSHQSIHTLGRSSCRDHANINQYSSDVR